MCTIGVDIGGTKIAIGVVDTKGTIIIQSEMPTNKNERPSEMIEEIIQEIQRLVNKVGLDVDECKGVGIGAPGPLKAKEGIIACPPNLPNWRDVNIVQQMSSYFSIPIVLENDANAAALGEKWIGSAQRYNNFIYVTISTGIGAGIYLNNQLITGVSGNAGDVGHIVIDPSYGRCICGQEGCFEYVASGTAISRICSEIYGREITTREAFSLYESGDERVVECLNKVFKNIGVGMVTLINLFDPESIIIGGGVSKAGANLFKPIRQYVETYTLQREGNETEILPAKLSTNSGLIGAAALIEQGKA